MDAAHSEEDLPLLVLVCHKWWNKVLARINQLPPQAAVAELLSLDEFRRTALALASVYKAPVEVLESMIILAKMDGKKRNILDIADNRLALPLHNTAYANRHQAPCSPPPPITTHD